eukprot:8146225-Prorocentrum_lima.AAC.1
MAFLATSRLRLASDTGGCTMERGLGSTSHLASKPSSGIWMLQGALVSPNYFKRAKFDCEIVFCC